MRNLLILGSVAIVYCYYNWQLFHYESEMLNIKSMRGVLIHAVSLLNYTFFILMAVFQLHLCMNWTFFLVFLFAENLLVFRCSAKCAYTLALTGTAVGLAANIFLRSLFAIALNMPLVYFDGNSVIESNLRGYPVFLGFLAAGIMLQVIRQKKIPSKIRIILVDPISLRFMCWLQSILYIYLILNLLGYYTEGNSFPMKMWGIKSVFFSIFGLVLLSIYMLYVNTLKLYQQKIKTKREELLETKKDEEKIWTVAFTDALTGCYNRQYALEIFHTLEETSCKAILCFIDLDGLKAVNDDYGHQKGDDYLLITVKCIKEAIRKEQDYIFRYGGDEFLLLFQEIDPEMVDFRMRKVQKQLHALSHSSEFPFYLSISYGISCRSEGKNLKSAVDLADQRMYERKQKKKKARERMQ